MSLVSTKSFSDVAHLPSYNEAMPGMAQLLTSLVAKGDAALKGSVPEDRSMFNGAQRAEVSVQDYLIRLCKYSFCSNEVFVQMVIYLGRIRAKRVQFNGFNIHRLMLTAFVVAAKLRDDTYYSNKYYARIGGVTLDDMNRMEESFLTQTNWELYVDKAEYDQYYEGLAKVPGPNGQVKQGSGNHKHPRRPSHEREAEREAAMDNSTPVAANAKDAGAVPLGKQKGGTTQIKHSVLQRFRNPFGRRESAASADASATAI